MRELETAYLAKTPCTFVADFSEHNLMLNHGRYLADWLSRQNLHLYALELSLNQVQAAKWDNILPKIRQLLQHVGRLNLAVNYLPALRNIPALPELQR